MMWKWHNRGPSHESPNAQQVPHRHDTILIPEEPYSRPSQMHVAACDPELNNAALQTFGTGIDLQMYSNGLNQRVKDVEIL